MSTISKRKREIHPTPRLIRTSTFYQHERLPTTSSIRILELLPGEGTSILKCRLSIVERDHAPRYEAISYAWGDDVDSKVIWCQKQKLKVTTNLRDALRVLRHPYKLKYLWADAVCIDQQNNEERGYQVRQMSLIYANAERVVVWLNLPQSKITSFEDMFNNDFDAAADDSGGRASYLLQKHVSRLESQDFHPEDMDSDTVDITNAFTLLFESPWFRRLWVVQEVGMAKSVTAMIGDERIDFVDLIRFIIRLEKRTLLMDQLGLFISGKANVFTTFPARSRELAGEVDDDWDFLELMEVTRAQQASDPRDYVYALLGHPCAYIRCIPIMQPNYNKSVADVFFEVTLKILNLDTTLRALSAVHHTDPKSFETKTQTWIPEWSRDAYVLSLGVYRDHLYDVSYDACAGFPARWKLHTPSRSLHVRGFIFDTIAECIPTVEPDSTDGILVQKPVDKLLTAVFNFKGRWNFSREENLKDMGRTVTAGYRNENPKQFDADFAAIRLHLIHSALAERNSTHANHDNGNGYDDNTNDNDDDDSDDDNSTAAAKDLAKTLSLSPSLATLAATGTIDSIYWAASRFSMGRTMFCTSTGLLGLGPRVLREGDVCCVLFGASVPFVLRRVEGKREGEWADGEKWRVVGEAFVQGVMAGEKVVDFMFDERGMEEKVFEFV